MQPARPALATLALAAAPVLGFAHPASAARVVGGISCPVPDTSGEGDYEDCLDAFKASCGAVDWVVDDPETGTATCGYRGGHAPATPNPGDLTGP